ncbi:DUF5753 domain-containing protein [Kitasatospora sp. NPDC098663]|uniref:DUF5753 domain-containing protein n=1 Tax=Kitasatospora sp. NPDC098663 TaxID=3364096 RepID=UPI0037FCF23D
MDLSTVELEPIQSQFLELYRSATHIQAFEDGIVYGSLQTETYARAVFECASELYPVSPVDIEAAVQTRLARRELIDGERQFEIIMSARALVADVAGAAVLREQLQYLLECMERPGLTLGVIPTGTLLRAHWGFCIVNSVRVEVDQYNGPLTVTDVDQVRRFRETFHRVRRTAVFGDDARALISGLL